MRERADDDQQDGEGTVARSVCRLPALASSVAALRAHARAFAEARGAERETVEDLVLVVSEAATNAVVHAFVGREPGKITLTLLARPGALVAVVADDGSAWRTAPTHPFHTAPQPRTGAHTWPAGAAERLCALPLDGVADASCVDAVENGTLRRLHATVGGDPELGGRLMHSTPPVKPRSATWAALHGDGPQLVCHDPAVPRSPVGPGAMLGLGWWLCVPLADAAGAVVALWGLGGRGDRPAPSRERIAALAREGAQAVA